MSNVELTMSNHQRAELRYRGRCNVLSAGGRNSGKSRNLVHALLAHCEEFGDEARPLVCREERNALLQLLALVYDLCVKVFGPGVQRNLNDATIALPNGAVVMFTNISDDTSYARLQGMSFSALFPDEIGNYSPSAYAFTQRLRSNLRVREGRRALVWMTANPKGRSHNVLYKNFITRSPPWTPWTDEAGSTWVWTSSCVDDNPFVDVSNYKLQLAASTAGDPELDRAWRLGEWDSLGGNLFDNFDPKVHLVTALPVFYRAQPTWRFGCDWGMTAPAVALLGAEVPADTHGYAPGSVIIVDEFDTVAGDDLNVGTGLSPDAFADEIIQLGNKHGVVHKQGCIDDARGLQGETVITLMRKQGLYLHTPYKKNRTGGWLQIRAMLEAAKTGDGKGLYIHTRCRNLITSLTEAPRDPRRSGDVDHRFPDHHLDAARYLLPEFSLGKATFGRAVGIL